MQECLMKLAQRALSPGHELWEFGLHLFKLVLAATAASC